MYFISILKKICISQSRLSTGVVCVHYFENFVVLALGRKKLQRAVRIPIPLPLITALVIKVN